MARGVLIFRNEMESKTVGIIGAGQLGMMLAEEIHRAGCRVCTLDPSADAPAVQLSDRHIVAAYDDPKALEELCSASDVITYEFENIPASAIEPLVSKYNIKQGFRPLADSQNRVREKTNARLNGLPVARFWGINNEQDLRDALAQSGYPAIFKSATLGYDGHGQVKVSSPEDISRCLEIIDYCRNYSHLCTTGDLAILEEFVCFDYEVSVIMVSDGKDVVSFPIGRNIHSGGILDLCIVPAQMSSALQQRIIQASRSFMLSCGYEGILTIEYFVKGDEFYFNEMAPRPHNSGHYTIEGCTTNQYRELARYLLGQPLEQPVLKSPTIMKNILGEDLCAARLMAEQGLPEGVYFHDYLKSESRPKRKMGHITFTDTTIEEYDKLYRSRFVNK